MAGTGFALSHGQQRVHPAGPERAVRRPRRCQFRPVGHRPAQPAHRGRICGLDGIGAAGTAVASIVFLFRNRASHVAPVLLASLGAIAIDGTRAWLLADVRHRRGSLSRAAFLSARKDGLVNMAIIVMALVTLRTGSG